MAGFQVRTDLALEARESMAEAKKKLHGIQVEEYEIDISGTENGYGAYQAIKAQVSFQPKNLSRLRLIGEISYEGETLSEDVERLLAGECYFVSVKNETLRKIDPSEYEGDLSLRGEFVRLVMAKTDISDERKRQMVTLGLKALAGREVDE